MNPKDIPGYGIDASPSRRPGVPEYFQPPHAAPGAIYPPPRQDSEVKQLMHGRPNKSYPPVWGTAQPPSGLSGAIRAVAYKYPDHLIRHWTMLLFADRVESWLLQLRRGLPVIAALGALAFFGRTRLMPKAPLGLFGRAKLMRKAPLGLIAKAKLMPKARFAFR